MTDLGVRPPRPRAATLALLAAALLPATSVAVAAEPAHAVASASTAAAPAPVAGAASVAVSGDGVAMFPAFDPATKRYAVTTTAATGGTVTVTATATDGGSVRVDGRPVTGPTTLTGLAPGDEVSVMLGDGAGAAAYSLFVLPADFPTLVRTTPDSTLAALQRGHTLLTLGLFKPGSPYFETAVDANGVPVWVHRDDDLAVDLQKQPDGNYSVARTTHEPGRTGWDIVELGRDFKTVAVHRTTGLVDTDDHDSILLPDGRRFLTAYERDTAGLQHAVIQETDATGKVLFQWSSADHMVRSPALDTMAPASDIAANGDYAHMNSISFTTDRQLLVSFRHLSSVWKITLTAHDGFQPGDVEWRLGGRDSDFTFERPGEPADGTDGGPCAQHTATMLPNGHVLLWDNGSADFVTPYCVKGSDHYAPAVARPHTRPEEYELTPGTDGGLGTAKLVWTYDEPGRFSVFAGSARRQPNGDTLLGWAVDATSVATEVGPDGSKLWELVDTEADPEHRFVTYRATRADVPDWAPPAVTLTSPVAGLRLDQGTAVTVAFSCTDVGGSTLRTCAGTQAGGTRLDTQTPGVHTFAVRATDGAGQSTVVTHRYRVLPLSQPDLLARAVGTPRLVGGNSYAPTSQTVTVHSAAGGGCSVVRVQNDGVRREPLRVRATSAAGWRVTWTAQGVDLTGRVTGAGLSTHALDPGEAVNLCLRAVPGPGVLRPAQLTVRASSDRSAMVDRLLVRLRH